MSILPYWQKILLTRCVLAFLVFSTFTWLMPYRAEAYIMPAEQVVGLMMANFSRLRTLLITHTAHIYSSQDQKAETVLEERIWLKTPGFFRIELMGRINATFRHAGASTPVVSSREVVRITGETVSGS